MTPFAPVESFVRTRIGLDPASLGAAAFGRAVEGRMRLAGLGSATAYAGLLATGPAEWTALLADLIVPETWFFRGGRPLFDHLAGWVRDRAAARPSPNPVRILSAPCSTGEEPYSLAIALDELGVKPAAYRIDAIDLSGEHLLRAATASYAAFSFREGGTDPRPRHFQPFADGRWELRSAIREAVHFRPANLVEPGFLASEPPYDLILCRNLFIYLTPEARGRAAANLDRLLVPNGRLCLTPTEADRLPAARFAPDDPPGFSIFRRAEPKPTDTGLRSGAIRRVESLRLPSGGWAGQSPPVARGGLAAPLPAPPADNTPLPDPGGAARNLADGGKLDAARTACERAIAAGPTATLFSLLGVLHLAGGRRDDAAEAFRKALYLDPDHPDALTHMVVLCEQRGEPVQAAGFRRRLTRLQEQPA